MKKSLLLAALLGAGVMSAHAQSSVTLYGIVDAGVQYVSNSVGTSKFGFQSGGDFGDRWGLKGTEDLGGGLSAIFNLENGFNIGTGNFSAAGTEFNRQAFVGLASKQYGTLTFGRQYAPTTDLIEAYGPAAVGGIGTFPGDISDMDNGIRVNNSIKYKSLTYNGLTGEALYGFGNNAGQVNGGSVYAAGLSYIQGPIVAGATYYKTNGAVNGGTNAAAIANGNAISAGYGNAKSQQVINAVAGAQLSQAYVGLVYAYTQYRPSATSFIRHSVAYNSVGAVGTYQLNPALILGLSYNYTFGQKVDAASQTSAPRYQQIAGKAIYSLSKRTGVYLFAGYQHAYGQTLNAAGNVVNSTASVGDSLNGSGSNGRSQALVRIGMYNKF
ncbi:porin [Robbsia sp. KACC 23696]|uniref:porin n=1 Tax=Robbsia sp. KACC 23696 TaxID=3149231 RepID=UPI00325A90D7